MGLNILIPGLLIVAFITLVISAGFITDASRRITNINNYQTNPDLSTAHTLSAAAAITAWLTVFLMLVTVILLFVFAREKLTANKGILVYGSFILSLIGTLIVGVLSILTAERINSANVSDNQGAYRQAVIAAVLSIVVFSLIIITLIIRALYKPATIYIKGAPRDCLKEGGCKGEGGIPQYEIRLQSQKQVQTQLQSQKQVQRQVQRQAEVQVQRQAEAQYQTQKQAEVRRQYQAEVQRQVQTQRQAEIRRQYQAQAQVRPQYQDQRGLNVPLYQFMRALPREEVPQVEVAPLSERREDYIVPPLSEIPQYVYSRPAPREEAINQETVNQETVNQEAANQEAGINVPLLRFMRGLPREEVREMEQVAVPQRQEDYLVAPLSEIPQYVYPKTTSQAPLSIPQMQESYLVPPLDEIPQYIYSRQEPLQYQEPLVQELM